MISHTLLFIYTYVCSIVWQCVIMSALSVRLCARGVNMDAGVWMPNSRAVLFDRVGWATLGCRSSFFSFLAAYSRDKTQLLHQYLRVCRCILRVRVAGSAPEEMRGAVILCLQKIKINKNKNTPVVGFPQIRTSMHDVGMCRLAVMIDVQFDGTRARNVSGIILNICFHLYAPG